MCLLIWWSCHWITTKWIPYSLHLNYDGSITSSKWDTSMKKHFYHPLMEYKGWCLFDINFILCVHKTDWMAVNVTWSDTHFVQLKWFVWLHLSWPCTNNWYFDTLLDKILMKKKHESNTLVMKWLLYCCINSLRLRQNRRHFVDAIFKCIFLNENVLISIRISLNSIPRCSVYNIPALVLIMACRRAGDKPLSEPMMIILLTCICVTQPQWVKYHRPIGVGLGWQYESCGHDGKHNIMKTLFWIMGTIIVLIQNRQILEINGDLDWAGNVTPHNSLMEPGPCHINDRLGGEKTSPHWQRNQRNLVVIYH